LIFRFSSFPQPVTNTILTMDSSISNVETFLTNTTEEDMWGHYLKDSSKTSLRKLLPQSSTSPNPNSNNSYSSTNNRKWRILFSNPKILSDYNEETPAIASIEVRTRNDTTTGTVPERLYSSLKYEVTQEISSHHFGNTAVLMSKLQVVNPYNFEEEILKPNGKSIVKGTSELVPLTLNGNLSSLYSKTKVQFTDVSYHHEKKYFALKVSYYDPNNLAEAIFVQMSAPFQVFARRPRRKSLKRKSTMSSAPIPKKVKEEKVVAITAPLVVVKKEPTPMFSTLSVSPLNQFLSTVHTLENLTEKLSDSEIKCGIDSIEKLLQNLREHQTAPSHEHDVLSELDFFNI